MATRFYLPSSTAAPYTPPNLSAVWDVTTGFTSRATDVVKSDSAAATNATAKDSTVSNHDRLQRVYVSAQQLAAQTIPAGTFSAVLRAVESNAAADFWLQIIIRVMSSDGTTERGVLYGGSAAVAESATGGAENQEYPTTAESRIKNAIATASVVAQAGDRVHIEVGARGNGTTSTHTFSHTYLDLVANSDFTLAAGVTTPGLCPWVELSADLAWQVQGGSGAGAWSFAGTGSGTRSASGSGAGGWSFTGTGSGARASAGSGAASWSFTGAGSGTSTRAGSGSGQVAWAGTGTGSAPTLGAATGSGAGAWSFTGSGTGQRSPSGSGGGALAWTGAGSGARTSAGSGDSGTTWVGAGSGTAQHTGSGSGAWAWTGTGSGLAPGAARNITLSIGPGRSRSVTAAGRSRATAATGASRTLTATPRE